jgi:hypothetical protein
MGRKINPVGIRLGRHNRQGPIFTDIFKKERKDVVMRRSNESKVHSSVPNINRKSGPFLRSMGLGWSDDASFIKGSNEWSPNWYLNTVAGSNPSSGFKFGDYTNISEILEKVIRDWFEEQGFAVHRLFIVESEANSDKIPFVDVFISVARTTMTVKTGGRVNELLEKVYVTEWNLLSKHCERLLSNRFGKNVPAGENFTPRVRFHVSGSRDFGVGMEKELSPRKGSARFNRFTNRRPSLFQIAQNAVKNASLNPSANLMAQVLRDGLEKTNRHRTVLRVFSRVISNFFKRKDNALSKKDSSVAVQRKLDRALFIRDKKGLTPLDSDSKNHINPLDWIGCWIEIKGRINGSERARKLSYSMGVLPRNTFKARVDYGYCNAVTLYGIFSIRVWNTYRISG